METAVQKTPEVNEEEQAQPDGADEVGRVESTCGVKKSLWSRAVDIMAIGASKMVKRTKSTIGLKRLPKRDDLRT